MRLFCAGVLALALVTSTRAGIWDILKGGTSNAGTNTAALSGFSQDQVAQALRDALGNGIQGAITNLGREGGFLDNPKVKIPMPEKLAAVEKTLRSMKQDKLADEFVTTMNRAAERAVPEALPIFQDSLKSMTVDDAKKLVAGGNDSATQFFKGKGEKQIQDKMLPVIKEATAKTGVTSAYKKVLEQATGNSYLGKLNLNTSSLDVDTYVTQKASDGLFKMIAEEEKRIRENPAARTTELLDKVFGAVAKPK